MGILAAFWLLGLYAAAPALRTGARYAFVDRLRDALILGAAIPALLAMLHLLYPLACWLALACALAVAIRRPAPQRDDRPVPYVLIAALAIVAWPQLIRPLLDGDSLSYHLPNAASWVQAHSLWTTATRYWWYPPASELFAGGLYATSGPFALGWSGFGALALLGFRIATWAREEFAAPPLLADALAAATVTVFPLAIQAGTLQNDVWLAAFWLETLWLIGRENLAAMRAVAMTTLIKPQGWLFAVAAMLVAKAPLRVWLAAAGAAALWISRDAILWNGAIVPPASTAYAGTLASNIVAHGAPALALLIAVCARISPFALLGLCCAALGPLLARSQARLGWAGLAAIVLFLVMPFGYSSNIAQLATGASLRFGIPAIVVGVLIAARVAPRFPALAEALLCASAVFGAWSVSAVFWNDASTRGAVPIAFLVVAIAATAQITRRAWLNGILAALAIVTTTHLSGSRPVGYYTDALRAGGRSSGVYRWILRTRPPAIGGWGLRLGVVNVLSPRTRTLDLIDTAACRTARDNRALLLAVAEDDQSIAANAQRLDAARTCGITLYDDGIAVVALPANLR